MTVRCVVHARRLQPDAGTLPVALTAVCRIDDEVVVADLFDRIEPVRLPSGAPVAGRVGPFQGPLDIEDLVAFDVRLFDVATLHTLFGSGPHEKIVSVDADGWRILSVLHALTTAAPLAALVSPAAGAGMTEPSEQADAVNAA